MNAEKEDEKQDEADNTVVWDDPEDDGDQTWADADDLRNRADPAEERVYHEPDEEGKFHDDPLWWGKSLAEIRMCTEVEKASGNAASREGDWKKANRCWKNALKGAEKTKDPEAEFRLRLNLALGYTKLDKPAKALEHCKAALRESIRSYASPALQAKAHYRLAEAYEQQGDLSLALTSLKATLQVEPNNADARRKLAEIRKSEADRRERERAFFKKATDREAETSAANKAAVADSEAAANANDTGNEFESATSEVDGDSEAGAAQANEEEEAEYDEKLSEFDVSKLTDRKLSSSLFNRIGTGSELNMQIGNPMIVRGPPGSPRNPMF